MAKAKDLKIESARPNCGNEAEHHSDGVVDVHASSWSSDHRGVVKDAQVAHLEDELWRIKAVIARTGLSRSTIYSYIAQGLFPRQRRLGLRRVGWFASEVRAWITNRPI